MQKLCICTEFSLNVLVSLIRGSFKGLHELSGGGVSYGEDKGMVRLAIPNASLQHVWHVSWHFLWSLEMAGGKGSPGLGSHCCSTYSGVTLSAALARVSRLPQRLRRAFCCSSARPTLPGAKEKHMAGATLPAQHCQKQKPGCYKPCPEKRPFHTSINFKEREERRRRGVFALLSLMKYNQSRECILCFQPDIPSMCLAR